MAGCQPVEQRTRTRGRAEVGVRSVQPPPDLFTFMLQNQLKVVLFLDKLEAGSLIILSETFPPLLTIRLRALATERYPLINTEY